MKLVLDIGNTRIKWRMDGAEGCVAHTQEGWEAQLAAGWQGLAVPSAVFAGSVASERINQRVVDCASRRWPQQALIWLRSQASCCGVRIQYAEPERFGVDRLAALVGARALLGARPLVVVDVGTALTVDVLEASGLHRGGWIMPGLRLMAASLGAGAARLAQVDWGAVNISCAPQHASGSAILAGVRCMAQGGVRQALHSATGVLGVQPEVVICGGDAVVLAEALVEYRQHSRATLVLDGLAIMAEQG